jgi:hypothetical protein
MTLSSNTRYQIASLITNRNTRSFLFLKQSFVLTIAEIVLESHGSCERVGCRLFIHMSGAPGLGKTTTTELLTPHIDAFFVPHIIQSQLLESDISCKDAGKVACEMDWEWLRLQCIRGSASSLIRPVSSKGS